MPQANNMYCIKMHGLKKILTHRKWDSKSHPYSELRLPTPFAYWLFCPNFDFFYLHLVFHHSDLRSPRTVLFSSTLCIGVVMLRTNKSPKPRNLIVAFRLLCPDVASSGSSNSLCEHAQCDSRYPRMPFINHFILCKLVGVPKISAPLLSVVGALLSLHPRVSKFGQLLWVYPPHSVLTILSWLTISSPLGVSPFRFVIIKDCII